MATPPRAFAPSHAKFPALTTLSCRMIHNQGKSIDFKTFCYTEQTALFLNFSGKNDRYNLMSILLLRYFWNPVQILYIIYLLMNEGLPIHTSYKIWWRK